jgi:hypothetical protein
MNNSGWQEEIKLDKNNEVVVYEPRNMANIPGNVYLGKTFSLDLEIHKNLNYEQKVASKENCENTLLFASIIGGTNVRIDPATARDPYLYIDAKWFDLKPYDYYVEWNTKYDPPSDSNLHQYIETLQSQISNVIPNNNVLSSVEYKYEKKSVKKFEGGYTEIDDFISNPLYKIKTLSSDGSIVIESNDSKFWWGTNTQPNGDIRNINPDGILTLKSVDYSIEGFGGNDNSFINYKNIDDNEIIYTTSDFECGDGICIAEFNFSLNQFQGKMLEDLSDIIPEGVIQIGCLTKSVP